MVTNKRKKRLSQLLIVFIVLLVLSFYLLYDSFLMSYNNATSNLLHSLNNIYPEMTIPSQLFKDNLDFTFTGYFYLVVTFLVLILLGIYYIISNSYADYSKDIKHIISEIEHDEFVPSTLEGELSILEDKIYAYKKRNEKLIEKSIEEKKELSDYIENIAHQIKTPIASIRLNEELALLSKDSSLLENNKVSFERLDHLFDSFMKLARIENDSVHFQLELGTMDELLEELKQLCLPIIKDTQLIINQCDISFFYDQQWLLEGMYNIIKNCVEEGVSRVYIEPYYNKEMIHIIIRDNGKGIDEQDLPYIFNRFYRSQKNKKKGVGIGLALCKEIVLRHHGFINAYNDDGAVFDISFPLLDIKEKVI